MLFVGPPNFMILPIKILANFKKSCNLVIALHIRSISADIAKQNIIEIKNNILQILNIDWNQN